MYIFDFVLKNLIKHAKGMLTDGNFNPDVGENTFPALNVNILEELTFVYVIQLSQEPAIKLSQRLCTCKFLR